MSQTLSASTLLAVPLAPLAGALLAGIFGTTFGGNWIGRRLSHTLTILTLNDPGITQTRYFLLGDVSYENVDGDGNCGTCGMAFGPPKRKPSEYST